MSTPDPAGDITLDELARLIKLLGMLGSSHDGEALNAARLASKWLVDHATDWDALLTPEPEFPVSGVATQATIKDTKEAYNRAYDDGFANGMKTMAAQVKAQAAAMANQQAAQGLHSGLGSPYAAQGLDSMGGLGATPHTHWQAPPSQQAPPQQATPANQPTPGSWQAVAQALLDSHAQGVPGVFRGTREESFVADILRRGYPNLTGAQEIWLRDIAWRSNMTW